MSPGMCTQCTRRCQEKSRKTATAPDNTHTGSWSPPRKKKALKENFLLIFKIPQKDSTVSVTIINWATQSWQWGGGEDTRWIGWYRVALWPGELRLRSPELTLENTVVPTERQQDEMEAEEGETPWIGWLVKCLVYLLKGPGKRDPVSNKRVLE